MTRRCSHCSNNGHNSRTCPNRGVKIFGVRLDGSIRKSASMGNLTHFMGSGGSTPLSGLGHDSPADTPEHPSAGGGAADGYGSEDLLVGSSSGRERKKGTPWTEEEHRMFLLGLQKLGKGDWRGIARNFVISRTPTQVASHAQKYFIRQTNSSRRKRRSSLFDIVADESADTPVVPRDFFSINPQTETKSGSPSAPAIDEECESMESANSNDGDTLPTNLEAQQLMNGPQYLEAQQFMEGPQYSEAQQYPYPVVYPAYVTAPFFPVSIPYWPGYNNEPTKEETHEVVKPTAIHSKSPINVDELVGMSNLTLGDAGPTTLSLKLVEGSTRPSAFHANQASDGSVHTPIQAL